MHCGRLLHGAALPFAVSHHLNIPTPYITPPVLRGETRSETTAHAVGCTDIAPPVLRREILASFYIGFEMTKEAAPDGAASLS